jgi:hypothetical protein
VIEQVLTVEHDGGRSLKELIFWGDSQLKAFRLLQGAGWRSTRAEVPGVVARFVHVRWGLGDLTPWGPGALRFGLVGWR